MELGETLATFETDEYSETVRLLCYRDSHQQFQFVMIETRDAPPEMLSKVVDFMMHTGQPYHTLHLCKYAGMSGAQDTLAPMFPTREFVEGFLPISMHAGQAEVLDGVLRNNRIAVDANKQRLLWSFVTHVRYNLYQVALSYLIQNNIRQWRTIKDVVTETMPALRQFEHDLWTGFATQELPEPLEYPDTYGEALDLMRQFFVQTMRGMKGKEDASVIYAMSRYNRHMSCAIYRSSSEWDHALPGAQKNYGIKYVAGKYGPVPADYKHGKAFEDFRGTACEQFTFRSPVPMFQVEAMFGIMRWQVIGLDYSYEFATDQPTCVTAIVATPGKLREIINQVRLWKSLHSFNAGNVSNLSIEIARALSQCEPPSPLAMLAIARALDLKKIALERYEDERVRSGIMALVAEIFRVLRVVTEHDIFYVTSTAWAGEEYEWVLQALRLAFIPTSNHVYVVGSEVLDLPYAEGKFLHHVVDGRTEQDKIRYEWDGSKMIDRHDGEDNPFPSDKLHVLVDGNILHRVDPKIIEVQNSKVHHYYLQKLLRLHRTDYIQYLCASPTTGQVKRFVPPPGSFKKHPLRSVAKLRSPGAVQADYHDLERTLQEHSPLIQFILSSGVVLQRDDALTEPAWTYLFKELEAYQQTRMTSFPVGTLSSCVAPQVDYRDMDHYKRHMLQTVGSDRRRLGVSPLASSIPGVIESSYCDVPRYAGLFAGVLARRNHLLLPVTLTKHYRPPYRTTAPNIDA